jgi:hypothetical protein
MVLGWEQKFTELISVHESRAAQFHLALSIEAPFTFSTSKEILNQRTAAEQKLYAKINHRGGKRQLFRDVSKFILITRPHTRDDEAELEALFRRVITTIDNCINQDPVIDEYPIKPETCTPPLPSKREEKLKSFEQNRTPEDLSFYREVAKLEYRGYHWHA